MPSFQRTAIALAVLFLLLAAPTTGWAENRHHSLEIGASAELTRFDSNSGMQTDTAPSALVAFNFTKRHGMEVAYSSRTVNPDAASFEVDVDILSIGYNYNAYPRERVVPFLRTGMGFRSLRPESDPDPTERLEDSDRNLFIYGGAGFRYFFTESVAMRIDGVLRFVEVDKGFLQPDVEGTLAFGAVFLVGGRDIEPASE